MSTVTFHNALSKKREEFSPIEPGKVTIYNCGPTVYKRQHLGNMRRFLFADFLRRSLEFFGYEVREIMNITDVGHLTQDDIDAGEDKLDREAKAQKKTPLEIADEQTKQFLADIHDLNIQEAHKYPRATAHIDAMQRMITTLIEKGHAYETETGVYYDVASFPGYGKLSGNTPDKIAAGDRVAVRSEKKHSADFALWKTDDPNHLQQWDSPWGRGYPGWHIECSAMSLEYLGATFDIHTSGEDNRFPHHENEIAQSEGASGKLPANVWLYNQHLQLAGAKLAKRGGTQLTLDTLREHGVDPLTFRLFIFGTHYRSLVQFSWDSMAATGENLDRIRQLLRQLLELGASPTEAPNKTVVDAFSAALADDLNTPQALGVFNEYITDANTALGADPSKQHASEILATLLKADHVLGVVGPLLHALESESVPEHVQELADRREEARQDGKFEHADELRQQIDEAGYTLEDTPRGPRLIKR